MIRVLRDLDKMSDESWMRTLSQRKLEESVFHDISHGNQGEAENSKFYRIADGSTEYLWRWIAENSPGKIVLDYACGNGGCAIQAAKAGATLSVGLDISKGSILNARRAAEAEGLTDNLLFLLGDCERTVLPDESVDAVICSGMLHHLDLSYALPELRRIMKPGALVIAKEALNYNPAIKLYRRLTPHLRTSFEASHIVSHRGLRFASHFFEVRNVRYWHLATLLSVPFLETRLFAAVHRVLAHVDRVLLRTPGVRNLAWQFTFELVKRPRD